MATKIGFFNRLKAALFVRGITCNLCGAELVAKTRYGFCAKCLTELPFNDQKVCLCCGAPLQNEADLCINCMNYGREFKQNRSPLVYDGAAHNLIYGLKFGGKRYLIDDLSAMLADDYLKYGYNCEVVAYVPMRAKEQKARGFNQSKLLAEALAKRLNLPITDTLIKVKETSDQKKLGAADRRENLKGVFLAADKETIKGRRVLLVDDVFTTGATANECSLALKRAYAREVSVLTVCITRPLLYGEKAADTAKFDKNSPVEPT